MRVSGKPTIINGTLTSANTEYEIDLPKNCHKFTVQARTNVVLKIAFIAGNSGTAYITIPSSANYWEDGIRTNSNIYAQSPTAGAVIEVIAWSGGDDLL